MYGAGGTFYCKRPADSPNTELLQPGPRKIFHDLLNVTALDSLSVGKDPPWMGAVLGSTLEGLAYVNQELPRPTKEDTTESGVTKAMRRRSLWPVLCHSLGWGCRRRGKIRPKRDPWSPTWARLSCTMTRKMKPEACASLQSVQRLVERATNVRMSTSYS